MRNQPCGTTGNGIRFTTATFTTTPKTIRGGKNQRERARMPNRLTTHNDGATSLERKAYGAPMDPKVIKQRYHPSNTRR
jgi:hypothetical protein